MEWYMPITILPGVSIILISTANLIISLNTEINHLLIDEKQSSAKLILLKLAQLKRLSLAMVSLYAGIFFFLLTGLWAMLTGSGLLTKTFLGIALLAVSTALVMLISYALKAVSIRQHQFKAHRQFVDKY